MASFMNSELLCVDPSDDVNQGTDQRSIAAVDKDVDVKDSVTQQPESEHQPITQGE